jgi:antitoxin HicB
VVHARWERNLGAPGNYWERRDHVRPAGASGHCQQVQGGVESRAMSGRSALADDAVRHYLNLPYRIALTRDAEDEERPWRATIEELPGCNARGLTSADAAERIMAALAEWVASARAEGREVPEPRSGRAYSGRLLLRMPQTLHGDLADAAERNQVSLNTYINMLLVAARESRRPEWSGPPAAGPASNPASGADATGSPAHTARLQRFLAIALAANVLVVAIAATIAVILLISTT